MGLFDQILNAVQNPNQEASPNQLGNILGTVQQLSNNYGADPATTQVALSILGNYVRSSLQNVRDQSGQDQAQAIVNNYAGTTPNPQAVQSLFTPNQVGQIADVIAQRTGLNSATIQAMIPILVPLVLNFLKTGTNVQNPQAGSNPVLNSFLDADGDNDVDLGDALSLAGRFLNQR